MRWHGLFIILAVMIGFVSSPSDAAPEYSDITDHWGRDYILPLTVRGVVNGYPDGTFRPDKPLTQSEWAKILVAALGDPLPSAILNRTSSQFADVPDSHWARPFVEAAWEYGWLEGTSPALFKPHLPITRSEAVTTVVRAAFVPQEVTNTRKINFADERLIPEWARQTVKHAVAGGFINGYSDGTFRPSALLTRAEGAALIYRLLDRRAALYDLTGTIVAPPTGRSLVRLRVRLTSGKETTLTIPPAAGVRQNGASIAAEDLGVFGQVSIILDKSGAVGWVDSWLSSAEGRLATKVGSNRRIRIGTGEGEYVAATVAKNARVFRNGVPVAVTELQVGDRVMLVFGRDGQVQGIDAVAVDVSGLVWGQHLAPATGLRLLIGERNSESDWHSFSPNARIYLNGYRSNPESLQIGDRVIAAQDKNGNIVYLESYRLPSSRY